MTTTNHSFTLSGLTFIIVLSFSSSMPLSRRHSVFPHLCYRIDGMFTYKLEGYSVKRVLSMIQDDKRE